MAYNTTMTLLDKIAKIIAGSDFPSKESYRKAYEILDTLETSPLSVYAAMGKPAAEYA